MSVFGVLGALNKFLRNKSDCVNISNTTFALHKKTAVLLLAFSILITSRQFFGEPIHCQLDTSAISLKLFESYCFMSGTYTLVVDNSTDGRKLGDYDIGHANGPDDLSTIHHGYYQWVCLVLVLQAAVCYIPWLAWKIAEGGKLGKLLVKLSDDPLTETTVEEQVTSLGEFLLTHRGWFNASALKLLLCCAACLVNSLGQLYAMDMFLGQRFFHLGSSLHSESLGRALRTVFPRLVMCYMPIFGASGTKVTKSGLCVLPQNILNEKVYLVLWFWFICLAIISSLQLLRQAALLQPCLRTCLSPGLSSRITSPGQVGQLISRGSYGDTILLQLIAANCDSAQFSALVHILVREQVFEDSYVCQPISNTKGNYRPHQSKYSEESFTDQNLIPVITRNS